MGQAINGDWGKALAFFFGTGALTLLVGSITGVSILKSKTVKTTKALLGALGGYLAALGVKIWSIVDAVKNAKSTVMFVEKENTAAKEE